jgi:hypothetical protein
MPVAHGVASIYRPLHWMHGSILDVWRREGVVIGRPWFHARRSLGRGSWHPILVLAAAMLCLPSLATAQIKTERKLPQLGGHTFIPSVHIREPFVTTYLRNATGVGMALDLDISLRNLDDEVIATLNGDLAFFILGFEYQQALAQWLAVRGGISGLARIGVNEESILAQGISAVNGFELGALGRLWRNEKAMLSASFDLRRTRLIGVDLIRFAQSIIDNGGIVEGNNHLVKNVFSTTTLGGLRFAYGWSEGVGLSVAGEVGRSPSFEEGVYEWVWNAGAAASIDLDAWTPVPVGFLLGYFQDSYSRGGDDMVESIQSVELRIAYTGREEFSAGLNIMSAVAPVRDSDADMTSVTVQFTLRYYF